MGIDSVIGIKQFFMLKESLFEVCIDVGNQTKICIAQNMSMKKE